MWTELEVTIAAHIYLNTKGKKGMGCNWKWNAPRIHEEASRSN